MLSEIAWPISWLVIPRNCRPADATSSCQRRFRRTLASTRISLSCKLKWNWGKSARCRTGFTGEKRLDANAQIASQVSVQQAPVRLASVVLNTAQTWTLSAFPALLIPSKRRRHHCHSMSSFSILCGCDYLSDRV
jgi:hypothetical protein